MTKRTSIKKLLGPALHIRAADKEKDGIDAWSRDDLIVRTPLGDVVAIISRDGIFDANGNHFLNDD